MNPDIQKLKNTFVNTDVYINGDYIGVIKDVDLEPGIRKKDNHWVVIRPILHLTVQPPNTQNEL